MTSRMPDALRRALVLATVVLSLGGCSTDLDRPSILIGLGPGAGGWLELLDAAAPHEDLLWIRVGASTYNERTGEARPVLCDVDGDRRDEVVIGLGSNPSEGGRIEVKDDRQAGYAHMAWLQVDWPEYNAPNGETFPGCGDIDGDGKDEIVVGFGRGGRGRLKVFDDATASFSALSRTSRQDGWLSLDWRKYEEDRGEVHPAVGNLDQDPAEEIVLGLGRNSGGWVRVLDDARAGFRPLSGTPRGRGWLRVQWPSYNLANGETWPAVGDLDGDTAGELVLGLGEGGKGWLQVLDDHRSGFVPVPGLPSVPGWVRVVRTAYNDALTHTYPACGDMDGDGRDELVVGLGVDPSRYPNNGGWLETREDLTLGLAHRSWARLRWPDYNAANGLTRPAVGRFVPAAR